MASSAISSRRSRSGGEPMEYTFKRKNRSSRKCFSCTSRRRSRLVAAITLTSTFSVRVSPTLSNCISCNTRTFDTLTFADWRQTMAVNLDSMFLVTKAFINGMQLRKWGRIVNIASNSLGSVSPNHADYIASKGGVVGFTRALASEMGVHGITVNASSPGLTRTPGTLEGQFRPRGLPIEQAFDMISQMQAIKRHEKPEDLAGAVAFLTSDDTAFMSGQTMIVDGGLVRV